MLKRGSTLSSKLIFFGDSTAAKKDVCARPETGWAECLEKYLSPNYSLINLAVNGMSSKKCIDTGLFEKGLKMVDPGSWCMIEFGHNEYKADEQRYSSLDGFYSNLVNMACALKEKGCSVLLMTPIVRRKFSSDGKIINTHGEYPDVIRRVASGFSLFFVDMEKITESFFSRLGEERSKACFMHLNPGESHNYPQGIEDDTHLSLNGAEAVASLFVSYAKKNLMLPFIGGMML